MREISSSPRACETVVQVNFKVYKGLPYISQYFYWKC